jgi:hypothetical protein
MQEIINSLIKLYQLLRGVYFNYIITPLNALAALILVMIYN